MIYTEMQRKKEFRAAVQRIEAQRKQEAEQKAIQKRKEFEQKNKEAMRQAREKASKPKIDNERTKIMNFKNETAQKYFDAALNDAINKLDDAERIRTDCQKKLNKAKDDLNNGYLGEQGFKEIVQNAANEAAAALDSLKSSLDKHSAAYAERMKEYGLLSGDRITSDVKLLDGSIALSAADVDELLDRYGDNYLMQRKIMDFWKTRRAEIEAENESIKGVPGFKASETGLQHKIQSPQEKQAIFDKFLSTMKNALGSADRGAWTPDEFKTTSDYMRYRCSEYLSETMLENSALAYDMSEYEVERRTPKPTFF